MELYQSFWSKPHENKRWGINNQLEKQLYITALSVVYAKRSGCHVVMHTDDFGLQLLEHLPYDDIVLTLNDMHDLPHGFWAAGKIWAHEAAPLGAIHIDNDVFVKGPKCVEALTFDNYDLICQQLENADGSMYDPNRRIIAPAVKPIIDLYDVNRFRAWNCGVVGFNSQELKDTYISKYKKCVDAIISNDKLLNMAITNNNFTPDLTIEQEMLYDLSVGYNVKALFIDKRDAVNIQYQHLIGQGKYQQMDNVKLYLRTLNKDVYDKTELVINKYIK